MDNLELSLFLAIGSFFAGIIGALSGMGGGIVIVPLLVVGAGVEIHYAIGASLLAVIGTSLGSSITYEKEGYCNDRLATLFMTITTLTAILGAHMAAWAPADILSIIFGLVLLVTVIMSLLPHKHRGGVVIEPHRLSATLQLDGSFPTESGPKAYQVHGLIPGYLCMSFAGLFSGLLGIGSGSLQVPIMDRIMRMPFKVATATSALVIGITGVASAGIYLSRGYIDPVLTTPVVLGNILGAFIGSLMINYVRTSFLRKLFLALITLIAFHMLYGGIVK